MIMEWKDVGQWLKENAGSGAALVGSLLTGNIPGAVAAGVSMIGSATGVATPDAALAALQGNPETLVKLKEIALANDISIREHIRAMTEAELKDRQAEHEQTQLTIRSGDNADDAFVRFTRPGQSWVSLIAALAYVFTNDNPDEWILTLLLTLPWAYAGLRQIGKGVDSMLARKGAKAVV
jgi:hypothetical protein